MIYYTCCFTVQIEAIGDKPLRDVVHELGGWPVAEAGEWTEPEWPLEHLLGLLRGDYNQGIVIEQWVGPDDKNSSTNVIQVRLLCQNIGTNTHCKNFFVKNG